MIKFFLVHCANGLRKPILYKRLAFAEKRCIKQSGYQIIYCNSQSQGKELLKTKMDEHQLAINANKLDVLKTNLLQTNAALQDPIFLPEQSKFIEDRQRINRQKFVNQLFCAKGFLNSAAFKSFPILVSPLIEYKGFFDGASRGNPGPSAVGFLLKYLNTTLLARNQILGTLTNNQAELISMGFLMADSYCSGVQHLRVIGDSKLAIEFMKGNFTVQAQKLVPLFEGNKSLAAKFQTVKFQHVKREFNSEADRLAFASFPKNVKGKSSQDQK